MTGLDDRAEQVNAIIAEVREEYGEEGKQFSWIAMARSTEQSLAADRDAQNFDPSDHELWQAVAAELWRLGEAAIRDGRPS